MSNEPGLTGTEIYVESTSEGYVALTTHPDGKQELDEVKGEQRVSHDEEPAP